MNNNPTWRIKRYIVEEFSVQAKNKKEALHTMDNGYAGPHTVNLIKETCVKLKE